MYVVLGFTPRIDAASIRRSLRARGAVCRAVGARVAPTGGLLSAMVRGDLRAFVHNVVMRRGDKRMMRAFRRYTVLLAWVVLVGVATGCGAIVLHWVLGVIEVVAFGHDETLHPIITYYSSTPRRVVALVVVGFCVAATWYVLQSRRWGGGPLASVESMVRARSLAERRPGFVRQGVHALVQIVAVGAGSPVGKEVAPRELGALFAGRIADWGHLPEGTRRTLVASAAAAGLAADYQVPVAGVVFLFEALGLGLSVKNVLVGAFTVGVATATAHLTISDQATYPVVLVQTCWESLALAVLLGVVLAPGALWFRRLLGWAQRGRVTNRGVLWRVPLVFAAVGVVSMVLPEVMGNGRALVQQTFNRAELVGSFTVPALLYTLGLFVAKGVLVVAALRHGSYGGTLTPGVALGASGGFVVAGTLVCVCPWVSGFPLGVTGLLSGAGGRSVFGVVDGCSVEFCGAGGWFYGAKLGCVCAARGSGWGGVGCEEAVGGAPRPGACGGVAFGSCGAAGGWRLVSVTLDDGFLGCMGGPQCNAS